MAKKEMRMLAASADLGGLIDHGFDVDAQLKNLTFEDKGIKTKITDSVSSQMEKDETSVKVLGARAGAMVTAVESVELNPEAKRLPEVMKALDDGLLDGIVTKTMMLSVDSRDAEKAKEILVKAGLKAKVATTMKVSAEGLREAKDMAFGPAEGVKALEALKESVTRSMTFRVKYEEAKG